MSRCLATQAGAAAGVADVTGVAVLAEATGSRGSRGDRGRVCDGQRGDSATGIVVCGVRRAAVFWIVGSLYMLSA